MYNVDYWLCWLQRYQQRIHRATRSEHLNSGIYGWPWRMQWRLHGAQTGFVEVSVSHQKSTFLCVSLSYQLRHDASQICQILPNHRANVSYDVSACIEISVAVRLSALCAASSSDSLATRGKRIPQLAEARAGLMTFHCLWAFKILKCDFSGLVIEQQSTAKKCIARTWGLQHSYPLHPLPRYTWLVWSRFGSTWDPRWPKRRWVLYNYILDGHAIMHLAGQTQDRTRGDNKSHAKASVVLGAMGVVRTRSEMSVEPQSWLRVTLLCEMSAKGQGYQNINQHIATCCVLSEKLSCTNGLRSTTRAISEPYKGGLK